jgi:Leu/Phe-tRNA-protein transferase
MNWPWISRKAAQHYLDLMREGYAMQVEAAEGLQGAAETYAKNLLDSHVRDLAARAAAIVYEQQAHAETKATLGRMTIACRDFEEKLRDCKDPPITRKELGELIKRHSFVTNKAEVLERHNAELQAKLDELQAKRKRA